MKKTLLSLVLLLSISGCNKDNSTLTPQDNGLKSLVDMVEKMEAQQLALEKQLGSNTNRVLFRTGIYHSLGKAGITNFLRCHISHAVYEPVDIDWLNGDFAMQTRKLFFDLRVSDWYEKGSFHCEDYAEGAQFLARALHRNLNGRIKSTSCAIGVVYYRPNQAGIYAGYDAHAINFAILRSGRVVFWEPQNQLEVKLTDDEIASVFFWSL